MVNKKNDFNNFKKTTKGIVYNDKDNTLTFLIDPRKLIKGSGFIGTATPYALGVTIAISAKLIRDAVSIVYKIANEGQTSEEAKKTTKDYFKKEYGTFGKALKNLVLTPELGGVALLGASYNDILDKLPSNTFTDGVRSTVDKINKAGQRLDLKISGELSDKFINSLKNKRKGDVLATASKFMNVTKPDGKGGTTDKTKQEIINELLNIKGTKADVVDKKPNINYDSNLSKSEGFVTSTQYIPSLENIYDFLDINPSEIDLDKAGGEFIREELFSHTVNDLRKLASSIGLRGVASTYKKHQLVEAIVDIYHKFSQ